MATNWEGDKLLKQQMQHRLHLLFQKELVEAEFPQHQITIQGGVLKVFCRLKHPNWKNQYRFRVEYHSKFLHKVFLTRPPLTSSADIHLLEGGEMCLYYRPAWSPFRPMLVANDLIPMAIHWIQCYEIWLYEKKEWPAPWVSHGAHVTLERWIKAEMGSRYGVSFVG